MSDPDEQDGTGPLPPGGLSLGGLGADADRSLNAGDETPPPEEPAGDEALALPRGALVAFRKSGGLRFSSRAIVVRRSGWVEPMAGTPGRRRRITEEALATLERLLLQSGLTRVSHRKGRGTADGYSYEIAAHLAGKERQLTLDDPVPAEQERLVRVLQRLLPGG